MINAGPMKSVRYSRSAAGRIGLLAATILLLMACGSADETGEGDPCRGATCPGSLAPAWELTDFQPKSPHLGQSYGLSRFRGTPTLVALLSGWCSFCQSQAEQLQRMHNELVAAGHALNVVAINSIDAVDDQVQLTARASFPMFQDQPTVSAWSLHGGQKDDLYLYDAGGRLADFLSPRGTRSIVLSSDEGYENVRNALLSLLEPSDRSSTEVSQ